MIRIVCVCVTLILALPAFGQNRAIPGIDSQLTAIEFTYNDRYLVVGDETSDEVIFIDPVTEQVVSRQPVPGGITDFAATGEESVLVATGAGLYEATPFYSAPFGPALPDVAVSVAYNGHKVIAVGTGTQRGTVVLINARNGKIDATIERVYRPLVRLDGDRLFVGEQGLSPASLYHYRLHPKKGAIFVAEDQHGSLGSNLRDFEISGSDVFVACGSPYGIQRVDADTMVRTALLDTGAYPAGVDVANGQVFGLPSSAYNNFLFRFDMATWLLSGAYELFPHVLNGESQTRGVAVTAGGDKAFVLHGKGYYGQVQVQVVDLY